MVEETLVPELPFRVGGAVGQRHDVIREGFMGRGASDFDHLQADRAFKNPMPDAGRLLVLVGRSGLLPDSPAGRASHGRDWQRFDLDFSSPAQPAAM